MVYWYVQSVLLKECERLKVFNYFMNSVNFKKNLYSSYWLFCFSEIISDVYSKSLNEHLN